jgi:hypothetical protein
MRQSAQLQFHCGKPPPAAAPKTMIFRVSTDIFLPTKTGEGDGALVLLDVHIYSLRLYHLPLARGQRRP